MLLVLILALATITALRAWTIPEYALTPGSATPVAPLVKIVGVATDTHNDEIMFTDVYLQQLSVWQWLTMHLEQHVQFVPASDLVEPGIPLDELSAQGYLEMSDSKLAAEVAAFRSLGWKARVAETGSIVTGVAASSPARTSGVHVGDEIVGIDGALVRTSCDLVADTFTLKPGTQVHLSIKRAHISKSGVISYGLTSTFTMAMAKRPNGPAKSSCAGVQGVSKSWLGISLEDGVRYALPALVSIRTASIGGPSAGLAMTLALIDKLSGGSLTGHNVVAATGTISANGDVGLVGGVAEKAVAVERAGAKVFFVPKGNVGDAKSADQPGLRIVGVTTLQQVLDFLRTMGGVAPVALTRPH